MSLLAFPPLNTEGRPYAIQELNGRIITGNNEEFLNVGKSELLAEFPIIEKARMNTLQHSISKENMRNVFATRDTGSIEQAWDKWNKQGVSGVVEHVANATEPTRLWPLAKIGRGVLKLHNGMSSLAARVLPSYGQEKVEELLQTYSHSFDWKNSWLRCVSVHADGRRMAVCQSNDYIRVFGIGPFASKIPLTLKHPQQANVACMAWKPFDQRVLAVAADNRILIWRLTTKSTNMKPSAQCAQVIEVSIGPISQLVWDKTTGSGLLAISPNSNRILVVDTSTGSVDSLGEWTGGNVTKIVPTQDGQRIAVLYTGNLIRVYDRWSWRDEKWGSLAGRATDAVWSPKGEYLLFSTEQSNHLYSIAFTSKEVQNKEGSWETHWIGETKAKQVFDISPVEFDPSELEIQGAVERPIIHIGGIVHSLSLSPDGERLTVTFRENPSVLATFIVDWHPIVRLIPSGFIEAPHNGSANIVDFMPKFASGALLYVVWSSGRVQYIPLIYGANSSIHVHTRSILDEISMKIPTIPENSSLRAKSISDSLASGDLPSSVQEKSDNDEIVLFTERIRQRNENRETVDN